MIVFTCRYLFLRTTSTNTKIHIYEIWLEKQGVCETQTCGISLKIITAGMYTHTYNWDRVIDISAVPNGVAWHRICVNVIVQNCIDP